MSTMNIVHFVRVRAGDGGWGVGSGFVTRKGQMRFVIVKISIEIRYVLIDVI